MKILLINVSLRQQAKVKFFPIGLGYIATAIKNAGFSFDLLDIDAHRYSESEVIKYIRRKTYDVVCLGCIVTGYKIIKTLSKLLKDIHPNCKIIVGNSVATSIENILLKQTDVDVAVMGEGDVTIVELLKTLNNSGSIEEIPGICFKKDGEVKRTSARSLIKDISNLPFIDYSIFDVEIYIEASRYGCDEPLPIPRDEVRALPVNTARGCPANCTFCYHVFKGTPYRHRSPTVIVDEIKQLINKYSLNYIYFWDETTFFLKKQALALSNKVLEEKLHFYWTGTCRGNLFQEDADLEIIKKMKESGCVNMAYSLESADESILKAMNKHVSVKQFAKQSELFQKAEIPVITSLVLGFPQETPETIKKTIDCCIQNKIYPSAGYLLPQPGSEMYDYARSNGFIKDEEDYLLRLGDRQDLRLNMTQMSDKEFESVVQSEMKRCNKALGIGLENENLIKTQHHRSAKKENQKS